MEGKQPGQRLIFVLFFSPPLILQLTEGVQWFYCRENYTRWGPTFSGGGGGALFRGGGRPNGNFFRNPYNL